MTTTPLIIAHRGASALAPENTIAAFAKALQSGAEASLSAGRWLEALQYVQRLSGLAPYDESVALLEASVLIAAGRSLEDLRIQ